MGKWIEDSPDPKHRKRMVIFSIALNLGVLCFFKYFNFFVESFVELFAQMGMHLNYKMVEIVLPIGISFYTFESMSYIIDISRGHIKASRNFLDYSVFISFFPHLVAGPIIRPRTFFHQIRQNLTVTENDYKYGLSRFCLGIFKKVYLADILAIHWADDVFENPVGFNGLESLLAAYAYAFQIYFDFSAYSDMAIGLSRACGIYLPENFNYPYLSKNLKEFWERWHISLSTWLRDYLYIPLGGNRKGVFHKYKNIFVTMALGGLWHGANITFVVWGIIHGIIICAAHLFSDKPSLSKLSDKISNSVKWFLTFHIVVLAWVYFRARDLDTAHVFIRNIFMNFRFESRTPSYILLILAFSFFLHLVSRKNLKQKILENIQLGQRWKFILILLFMIITVIIGEQHFQPFIYFQF